MDRNWRKKGWDILQLLITASIPVLLFFGTQYFSTKNNQQQQESATEKANQDTLVKYLDQMADSLKNGLLQAKPDSDKFIIAQSRTVIALQSVDKKRQHLIIQFLQASKLNQVSNENKPDRDGKVPWKEGDRVLLYQAQMSKANLTNSDLSGGVLIKADLYKADLSDANLSGADLRKADLRKADLSGAHLSDANLSGADLRKADLRKADLSGAHLSDADLHKANLHKADLRKADLRKADLRKADLSDVNLSGANLSGAENLTNEQIKTTCRWDKAIYTEASWDVAKLVWVPKDSAKNQKEIDEIKNDKASDPKTPPNCN